MSPFKDRVPGFDPCHIIQLFALVYKYFCNSELVKLYRHNVWHLKKYFGTKYSSLCIGESLTYISIYKI